MYNLKINLTYGALLTFENLCKNFSASDYSKE